MASFLAAAEVTEQGLHYIKNTVLCNLPWADEKCHENSYTLVAEDDGTACNNPSSL